MRTADESPVFGHQAAFWDGVPNFRLADHTPRTRNMIITPPNKCLGTDASSNLCRRAQYSLIGESEDKGAGPESG